MRLNSVRIRGLGPFREEAMLDLDALGDAKLVAVTGKNGEGKTFLLESAIAGACYRRMPNQGTLVQRATARDGLLETRVTNGRPLVLRHLVDGVAGKSEAVALAGDTPLMSSTKVSDFDAWAERYLPAPDLLYASIFGAQGSVGFVGASDGERKSIILRAKGIEHYEHLTRLAALRTSATEKELQRVLHDIRAIEERNGVTDQELGSARAALEAARAAVVEQREVLASVQRQAEEWRTLKQARDVVLARLAELHARKAKVDQQVAEVDTKLKNNRGVLARADEIRAAEKRSPELDAELRNAESEAHDLTLRLQADDAKVTRLKSEAQTASDTASKAQARIQSARERLRDEELVRDAAAQLDALRAEYAAAQAAETLARAEHQALAETRLAGAEERIGGLREGLQSISLNGSNPIHTATTTLTADDELQRAAVETPERIRKLDTECGHAAAHTRETQRRLETAELLAAREREMAQATADIAAAEVERDEFAKRSEELAINAESTRTGAATLAKQEQDAQGRLSTLRNEQETLRPLLLRVAPLAAADARIAELEPIHAAGVQAAAELAQQIIDLEPESKNPLPPEPNVAKAEGALAEAETARDAKASEAARIEAAFEQSAGERDRLRELTAEREGVERDLADWTLLHQSLGRNGLQAAEIDAAGPELTDLVNELLHSCHGPRFTATLDTQRLSADGKKTLEGCGYVVVDTVKGTEKDARLHSGGERVMLGEAIALALCVMSCRTSGVEGPTLVRDESGAALDPENARVYIAMLRRAAELVGASHVLFVSHSEEVIEMADARVVVENGKIRVE